MMTSTLDQKFKMQFSKLCILAVLIFQIKISLVIVKNIHYCKQQMFKSQQAVYQLPQKQLKWFAVSLIMKLEKFIESCHKVL